MNPKSNPKRLMHSPNPKNTIHKLINLDKKDISYLSNIQDEKPLASSNNHNDSLIDKTHHDLQILWQHIDSMYFQPTTKNDLDRIESLISQLYTNPPENDTVSPKNGFEDPAKFLNSHNFIFGDDEEPPIELLLPEEDLDGECDDITNEIELITNDQHIAHIKNVQSLLQLKDKLAIEQGKLTSEYDYDFSNFLISRKYDESTSKPKGMTNNFLMDDKTASIEANYLKSLILRLEDYQTAESIKCVIDCRKVDGKEKYQFCVIFDESMTDKEVWLNEDVLDRLDSLREQGIFKIHQVPQKTRRSLNAFNVAALQTCNQKMIHSGLELKDKPWKNVVKKTLGDLGKEPFHMFCREQTASKAKKLGFCHQCRYLFPQGSLVCCKYTSSKMGLLDVDPPYGSFETHNVNNILLEQKQENSIENISYLYKWKEEENQYVCDRKFCRACLKSNYDLSADDILHDKNWICFFCQRICYCSRCIRHEQIKKLVQKYTNYSENLQSIINESSLQKYILNFMKKPTQVCQEQGLLKPTKQEAKKKGRKPNSSQDPQLKKKLKNSAGEELVKPQSQTQAKRGRPRKDRSYVPGFEFCQNQEETIPGSKKQFHRTAETSSHDWSFKFDFDQFEKKDFLDFSSYTPINFEAFKDVDNLFEAEEIFMDDGTTMEIEKSKPQILTENPANKKRGRGRPRKVENKIIEDSKTNSKFAGNFNEDKEWKI